MYHTKRKTYPGRHVIRGVQIILIVAIALFGLAALDDLYRQRDQVRPEADAMTTYDLQPNYTYTQPETVAPQSDLTAYDYFALALNHQTAGQYWDAIDDYTRAIEKDPSLAASWLNRGVAFEQLGRLCAARKDYWEWMSRITTEIRTADLGPNTSVTVEMSEGRLYVMPFSARAGQTVSVTATSTVTGEPGTLGVADPLLVLLNSADMPVAGDDDTLYSDGSLINMNSEIASYMVQQDGVYSVVLGHAGGGSYGTLTVTLTVR